MKTSFFTMPILLATVMAILFVAAPGHAPAQEYTGGFYDDGFYADDWFYDYYDTGLQEAASCEEEFEAELYEGEEQRQPRQLQTSQIYENAEQSGLFDF